MLRLIPNLLTAFRLALIIPFLLSLYHKDYEQAFYLFLLAGLTDALDGWFARHFKWQSSVGSFIDPLADKLLIASSFIALALMGTLPWSLVVLVFLRDLTISLGIVAWFCLIRHRIDFEPTLLSKINTVFQIMLVTICLFELAFLLKIPYLRDVFMALTFITTLSSYIDYVWTWSKKACDKNHIVK
ncbi:MAG: CDP-alcohol phosphatidyltransferase family protein [Legionella sp.]|nr:CDP-alcohol phosphatidyltransferase family protein [Legionella sp.]